VLTLAIISIRFWEKSFSLALKNALAYYNVEAAVLDSKVVGLATTG
jgi:hypothetical protein